MAVYCITENKPLYSYRISTCLHMFARLTGTVSYMIIRGFMYLCWLPANNIKLLQCATKYTKEIPYVCFLLLARIPVHNWNISILILRGCISTYVVNNEKIDRARVPCLCTAFASSLGCWYVWMICSYGKHVQVHFIFLYCLDLSKQLFQCQSI